MSNDKIKIAVFVSGGGTNLQALIDKQKSFVTYCENAVTRWGRTYPKMLTPFMSSIRQYFQCL